MNPFLKRGMPLKSSITPSALKKALDDSKPQLIASKNCFEVYLINGQHCMAELLDEIGVQRELRFRQAGLGTGNDCDVDIHDMHNYQLIVWDKELHQLKGGLRFYPLTNNLSNSYLASLFNINQSAELIGNASLIEISRVFVRADASQGAEVSPLLYRNTFPAIQTVVKQFDYVLGVTSLSALHYSSLTIDAVVYYLLQNSPQKKDWEACFLARYPYLAESGLTQEMQMEIQRLKTLKQLAQTISSWHGKSIQLPTLIYLYNRLGVLFVNASVDKNFSNCVDLLTVQTRQNIR